jgi:hypothetical protein
VSEGYGFVDFIDISRIDDGVPKALKTVISIEAKNVRQFIKIGSILVGREDFEFRLLEEKESSYTFNLGDHSIKSGGRLVELETEPQYK